MLEGTVTTIIEARGFGFLAAPGHKDIFFHTVELEGGLEFNEQLRERRVRFDVVESPKGPRAVGVRAAE